jgi:cytochrome c-type biogenesis protein CcmH
MRKILTYCTVLLVGMMASLSYANYTPSRFNVLTKEIRCVVCQNQSIADSAAPLAQDLREKVKQMMIAGQSDEDIKNYLVQRYGEFILFKPRWHATTALLWLFPLVGLSIFAGILWHIIARNRLTS